MTPGMKWLVRAAVTAALLWAVTTQVEWSGVVRVMRTARPEWFAAGLAAMAVWRVLSGYQMMLLMRQVGSPLGAKAIIEINLIAGFYELFLPARLAGGAVRFARFSGPNRAWVPVLAAMAFNRFVDTLTLLVLGLGFWAAAPRVPAHGALGLGMAGLLAALLAFHGEVKHGVIWSLMKRWPAARRGWDRVPDRVKAAVDRTAGALIRSYKQYRLAHAPMLTTGGLSAARHLLGIVAYVWLARAISIELTWLDVGWVRTVLVLVMMLPVSIAGFGLREGSLVVLLAPLGVPAPEAVAFSLLIFALSVIFGLLGGLLELKQVAHGRA